MNGLLQLIDLKKKKLRNYLSRNSYRDFINFYTWKVRINKIMKPK